MIESQGTMYFLEPPRRVQDHRVTRQTVFFRPFFFVLLILIICFEGKLVRTPGYMFPDLCSSDKLAWDIYVPSRREGVNPLPDPRKRSLTSGKVIR